jgi:hypothetical protein
MEGRRHQSNGFSDVGRLVGNCLGGRLFGGFSNVGRLVGNCLGGRLFGFSFVF